MRAPAFWWKPSPDALAHLFSLFGAVYGSVAAKRMREPGERAGVPVICVGNYVAGGAGKTPTAIALARAMIGAGERPYFLSRGYGAARRASSPVRVDPLAHDAAQVGDEPLLLTRVAPTIVCANRPAGARLAVAEGASVIVMDDGFQSPSLAKDARIAVVDGAVGIGNGLCMPAGPLRAPFEAQLAKTDALIVIGPGEAGERVAQQAEERAIPVARGRLTPDADSAAALRGKRVIAFAGIGRPAKFYDTLTQIGAEVFATRSFADHHVFAPQELDALRAHAARHDAVLVTTEKDLARIGPAPGIAALPVALTLDDPGLFAALARKAGVPPRA